MAFQNGYMPASALVEVEPGKRLEAATAAAYLRAKRASGNLLKIASPDGAYRDYATQVDMGVHPAAHGLDPASSIPVASPGTSTHGLGTRVDLVVGAARVWANVHLPEFGFKREFGASDPGHWQYLAPTFASTGITPLEGEDMSGIIRHSNGSLTTVDGMVYQTHTTMATYEADALVYGPYKQAASDAQYVQAIANTQIKLAYFLARQNGTPGSAVDVDAIVKKVAQNVKDDYTRLEAKITALAAEVDKLDQDEITAITAAARAGAKEGTEEALADLVLVVKKG